MRKTLADQVLAEVEETAQHLATSGPAPHEEFGPADEHAVTHARHRPAAPAWWQRDTTRHWLVLAIASTYFATAVLGDQPTWYFVTALVALLLSAALLIGALRRR